MNVFIADFTFDAFDSSFCVYHMYFISIVGPTTAFFMKIVRKKEFGLKMSGFF